MAEMAYMAAHGLKRARPAELVPGTVSVVTARMDYLPRHGAAGLAAQAGSACWPVPAAGGGVGLCPRAGLPQGAARSGCNGWPTGMQQAVGPFGHRVFTDSAPVLEAELAAAQRHRLARQAHAAAVTAKRARCSSWARSTSTWPLPLTRP
jgi:epoxyqueuosine reductase